jgi:c(7)-type cytochrome triheme protein
MMRLVLRLAFAVLATFLPIRDLGAEIGDIVFATARREAGTLDIPPAFFPHFVHRMQFKCYVCHDAIFVMKAGANPITMEAIQEGKFCGACHNGKRAFQATFDTCPRCHRP